MTTQILAPQLTAARLRELLHYDPETGVFRWRVDIPRSVRAGDVAGCITRHGYRQIKIDKRVYRAHRLAWLYVHGKWPDGILDHKHGSRDCNRLDNIRACNGTQNNGNSRKHSLNTSGFKGVHKNGRWGTWVASIGLSGNHVYLGCYDSAALAAHAYDEAAQRLFGEFARTNKMMGLLP